ncbi:MAG: hypothetical protein HYV34_00895 [Candidatus Kerfeldbacteria bacterium]|nr:hypothetical protein [Candidatus Kerfeldbacteria bacterium]
MTKRQLESFYEHHDSQPSKEDIQTIVTKSVERLISKELIIGYGRKTAVKWFIQEIRLTRMGKRVARELLGKQQKLKI